MKSEKNVNIMLISLRNFLRIILKFKKIIMRNMKKQNKKLVKNMKKCMKKLSKNEKVKNRIKK